MSSKRLRTSTTFEQLMDGCIFALSGFQNPYRNEVHTCEFEIVLSSLLYLHYKIFCSGFTPELSDGGQSLGMLISTLVKPQI